MLDNSGMICYNNYRVKEMTTKYIKRGNEK